jgi:hypothetical protein
LTWFVLVAVSLIIASWVWITYGEIVY